MTGAESTQDTLDLQACRADFPALRNWSWFQNGGVSITPRPVAETHAALMQELFLRGPMHIVYPEEEYPRRAASMARLAEFLGADPEEIALTRGVSEAFLTVLRGMDWNAGDEIVITADEEAALLLPCLTMRDQLGIRVVKLPLRADPAQQRAALEKVLSPRTRLLAISHVTTDLGYRLPVRELCAQAAAAKVPSFVDMAHSAGLWPLSLRELGCDYAGLLSYKWMYAPYAAGLLYVKRDRIDSLALPFAGGRAESFLDFAEDDYTLFAGAQRFQFGPWCWPLVHAWAASADYLDGIGVDAIWRRTEKLSNRLKDALRAIPGITVYTPLPAEQSAALVAFSVKGWSGQALARELRRRFNIVAKALPGALNGMRASLPFFLLESEIDAFAEGIAALASEPEPPGLAPAAGHP